MKIGTKLALMLSILLAYWLVFSIIIAVSLIYPDFKMVEQHQAFEAVKRNIHAVKYEAEKLQSQTGDQAAWNELYRFSRGLNPAFSLNNFDGKYFEEFYLTSLIILDRDGKIFWSRGRTAPFLTDQITDRLKQKNPTGAFYGPALSREGEIFLFALAPITGDSEIEQPAGYLMQIRQLDDTLVNRIEKLTGEHFELFRADLIPARKSPEDQKKLDQAIILNRRQPGTPQLAHLSSYQVVIDLIRDFTNEHSIRIEVEMEGQVRSIGLRSLRSFIMSVILTAFFITLLQGFFLNRMVSHRLTDFRSHIKEVGEGVRDPITLSQPRDDEIDKLIVEYDTTMRALHTAEKQKNRLQQKLHHSQKMEAVGQLAGGIAHVFNNNLQAITGFTELIKKENQDKGMRADPDLETRTSMILKASQHSAFLTHQLLSFSKSGRRIDSEFLLNELLESASSMMQENSDKQLSMIVIEETPEILIRGDYMQLQNVFINILINAQEAVGENGKIEIRNSQKGDEAIITIRDNGNGIPEAIRKKVFDPFFTTKKLGEGTGMGLAEAYAIIKNHNGTIDCESTEGEGTLFTIRLPALRT